MTVSRALSRSSPLRQWLWLQMATLRECGEMMRSAPRRREAIDRLKKGGAPTAVINPALAAAEHLPKPFSVKPPIPGQVPHRIIFLRPLPFQHRFGAAILKLLAPVGGDGSAAVMPNYRSG